MKKIIFSLLIVFLSFIEAKSIVSKYYYQFNTNTIWIDKNNEIKEITFDLLNNIKEQKSLKPYLNSLFELEEIENLINKKDLLNKEEILKLDTLITISYDNYMNYLTKGFINWQDFLQELKKIEEETEVKAKWAKYESRKNFIKLLKTSITKNDINYAISAVDYTFPYGKNLEKEIIRLKEISDNGGFVKIPMLNSNLKKGKYYPQIKQLRQRLIQSNDLIDIKCLDNINYCSEFYDNELFNAVKRFQKRYGLVPDGVVGKNTIKKLNMHIEDKINTLRINLERMRWLPRKLGDKFILVNIPEYKLRYFDDEKVELKMDIIVGKKKFPTPVFSHKMSKIITNPHWKIPQTIVKEEIIPKLVNDSYYLNKENINVHENWDIDSLKFDVSSVDWSMYLNNDLIGTPSKAPMRFIQTPGGSNPLGKIKFLFPNEYSVYMHDTPEKDYFSFKEKTLSHGCIRLEKPFELFEKILPSNNKDNQLSENIRENDFNLSEKIPIHIVYLTAWVDENKKLQFRDDIYNYDEIQTRLLLKSSF